MSAMPPTAPAAPAPGRVVATDAGPVTLEDLPALRSRLEILKAQSKNLQDQAQSMHALMQDRFVDLGSALIDFPGWTPPADLKDAVEQGRRLRAQIAEGDAKLDNLKTEERHGLSGMLGKVGAWTQSRKLTSDRAALGSQLRIILMRIGQEAPPSDADNLQHVRQQADAAASQASDLEAGAAQATTAVRLVEDEVQRREASLREMGFDALYQAAYLKAVGPQPVTSPLTLQRGETALVVMPAHLSRQQTRTHYVGGSQGFSFPIGHTGIRYRVGSYHGHPVQQQFLGAVDTGSLVITNQRIAFIGATKAVSIPLAKLLHVQCYSDALAVFQQGHENADYYMVTQPKYALFMLNWAVSQSV